MHKRKHRARMIKAAISLCIALSSALPVFCQDSQLSLKESGSPVAMMAETEGFTHRSLMSALGKFCIGSGTLRESNSREGTGECILRGTDVNAKISGYMAEVTITQQFENDRRRTIDAIYQFPLPDNATVHTMKMQVADRVIEGIIKERSEAEQDYKDAAARGNTAALLNEERPNIFTQQLANVEAGKLVTITITYTAQLPFENGTFAFIFPTVIGPRFSPSGVGPEIANNPSYAEARNRNRSHVTQRTGRNLALHVSIDAGMPISNIQSLSHEVEVKSASSQSAKVTLKPLATIANQDFVLTWKASTDAVNTGYLAHKTNKSGYATFMMIPPAARKVAAAPKEIIFAVDCSGSMDGAPLEKAKQTMHYAIDHLGPQDSFQIVAFNTNVDCAFGKPQRATEEVKAKGHQFIASLSASGGTVMLPAIERVCATPADNNRLRIVSFMTDGFVGNDMEVIALVKKLRGTSRWFPFGVGNSVNHFLINSMALEGGGEATTVSLSESEKIVSECFYNSIAMPLITDVHLTATGVELEDVYPKNVADVWQQKPIFFKARYKRGGKGTVTLSGFQNGHPYSQAFPVVLPEHEEANASVAKTWAQAKVDDLLSQDWQGAQVNSIRSDLKQSIIRVGLQHNLMTPYTSFVAVDRSKIVERASDEKDEAPSDVISRENSLMSDCAGSIARMEVPRGPGVHLSKWIANGAAPDDLSNAMTYPNFLQIGINKAFEKISNELNRLNTAPGSFGGVGSPPPLTPDAYRLSPGTVPQKRSTYAHLPPGTISQLIGASPVITASPRQPGTNEEEALPDTVIATGVLIDLFFYAIGFMYLTQGLLFSRGRGWNLSFGVTWFVLCFFWPLLSVMLVIPVTLWMACCLVDVVRALSDHTRTRFNTAGNDRAEGYAAERERQISGSAK